MLFVVPSLGVVLTCLCFQVTIGFDVFWKFVLLCCFFEFLLLFCDVVVGCVAACNVSRFDCGQVVVCFVVCFHVGAFVMQGRVLHIFRCKCACASAICVALWCLFYFVTLLSVLRAFAHVCVTVRYRM